MKILPISHISRYSLRHFFFPFISSLTFITSIILIFYMKEVIKGAVEKGIPGIFLLKLFLYSSGWTLGLTIPMAALLGVIVAVGQMNTDSEIIAMRAGGISYFRIFRPFLIAGIFLVILQFLFNQFVVPYSVRQMEAVIYSIRHYDPTVAINEGLFTKLDEKGDIARYIFVEKTQTDPVSGSVSLYNIQLRQTREINGLLRIEQLTLARKGEKILKIFPDKKIKALRLFGGYVFSIERNNRQLQRVNFNNGYMDINIHEKDPSATEGGNSGKIEAMNFFQLQKQIAETRDDEDRKNRLLLEFHKRTAKPAATLFFIFLGFPLAIVNKRSGKGGGVGFSMIFIFMYFVLLLSADTLVINQKMFSPFIATWLSNFVVLAAAFFFYVIKTGENSFLQKLRR